MLKILLSILLSISPVEGWDPVEKPVQRERVQNVDPMIWPVFALELGGEKLLARFPVDPSYRYLSDGGVEIEATMGSETYTLSVTPKSGEAVRAPIEALSIDPDTGYAVHERWVESEEHLYHLSYLAPSSANERFSTFADSLDIERIS